MAEPLTINSGALEPLFAPWEEPHSHRVRAENGEGAVARKGRRSSIVTIAQQLRAQVKEWRDNGYFGGERDLALFAAALVRTGARGRGP